MTQYRDLREANWFWVDNRIIDEYGMELGPYGLAVYMVLVRHALPNGRESWPSIATIAAKAGISEKTAREWCHILARMGLIQIVERFRESGGQTSNEYQILSPPVLEREGGAPPAGEGGTPVQGEGKNTPSMKIPIRKGERSSPANEPTIYDGEPYQVVLGDFDADLSPTWLQAEEMKGEFHTPVYEKDPKQSVTRLGKARVGPWIVACPECNTDIQFTSYDEVQECISCGNTYQFFSGRPRVNTHELASRNHPAVQMAYRILKGRGLRQDGLKDYHSDIAREVLNIQAWKEVLVSVVEGGGNPYNIPLMLQLYKEGRLYRQKKGGADGRPEAGPVSESDLKSLAAAAARSLGELGEASDLFGEDDLDLPEMQERV